MTLKGKLVVSAALLGMLTWWQIASMSQSAANEASARRVVAYWQSEQVAAPLPDAAQTRRPPPFEGVWVGEFGTAALELHVQDAIRHARDKSDSTLPTITGTGTYTYPPLEGLPAPRDGGRIHVQVMGGYSVDYSTLLPDSQFWFTTATPGGSDAPFQIRAKWQWGGRVMLVSEARWQGMRHAYLDPWTRPEGVLRQSGRLDGLAK